MRLDNFISELKDISRSRAQNLIKKECVVINGKTIKKNAFDILGEEEVIVKDLPVKDYNAKATEMTLDIIFENDNIVALNKKKGKQVHPGDEQDMTGTLLSGFRHYFSKPGIVAESDNDLTIEHLGFIHRLDKDTSGVLLVSKDKKVLEFYQSQFAAREVEKIYLSFVHGKIEQSGMIDSPIGRSEVDRKKMAISTKGKEAKTLFDPIKYYPELNITLLKVQILTGRTHQIRVHLSSIGYPIVGDPIYGNKTFNKEFTKKFGITSQVLHSYYLSLKGYEGEKQEFRATPPNDFTKLGFELDDINF